MPPRTPAPADTEISRVILEKDEAAWLVGTNDGLAIRKIAQASSTMITTHGFNQQMDIVGTALARKRATKYVDFVISQMDGVFRVDDQDLDDDCSVAEIPEQVVGFVTGGHGAYLRHLEAKWGVIMFFAEYNGKLREPFYALGAGDRTETLLIFGPRYARRGAQLAAMGVVEEQLHGYYSDVSKRTGEMFEGQWCKWKDSADWTTSTMEVKENLIPYVVGKKGNTLSKVMRASAAVVYPVGGLVYISGTKVEQQRAREYLGWMLEALDGPIHVPNLHRRCDATTVVVPTDSVAIVTGNARSGLTKMEDEWGVIMMFLGNHGPRAGGPKSDTVPLLIFAESTRSRTGAELDTMTLIEWKNTGFCTRNLTNKMSNVEGFDVEYWQMTREEVGFALGTQSSTRKKIIAASGALLQFVGLVCCIGGTRAERKRCRDYLEWLLQQMNGGEAVIDTRGRDDVSEMDMGGLEDKAVGVVTGRNGKTLRKIAEETGTWCMIAQDHKGIERLCIFSHEAGSCDGATGRKKAEKMFRDALHEAATLHHARNRGTTRGKQGSQTSLRQMTRGANGSQVKIRRHGKLGDKPDGKPDSKPHGKPHGKLHGKPHGKPNGKPHKTQTTWYKKEQLRLMWKRRYSNPWKGHDHDNGKPPWQSWEGKEQNWEGNGKSCSAWKDKRKPYNAWDPARKPRGRSSKGHVETEDVGKDVKAEQSRSRSARGRTSWELPETSSTRSPSYDYSPSRSSSPRSASQGHHRPSPRLALRSGSPTRHKYRDRRWRTRSWQM